MTPEILLPVQLTARPSMLVNTLVSLLILLRLGSVSPNIESWQHHLDQGELGAGGWSIKDDNLTECLGSCLCNGAQADCSHRGLASLPLIAEKNLVIHTL